MRKKPQSRSISSLPSSSFRRERNLYATTTDGLTGRTVPTDYYSLFCSDLIPLPNYQKRNRRQEKKKQSPQLSPWSDRTFFPSFKPQCVCPRLLLPTSKLMKTQNTKKKRHEYQYNNISFPSSFLCFFSFLGFTKHFTKSEGKKRTKHIHTGLLLQFQQRLILVTTTENKTETKSRKKI